MTFWKHPDVRFHLFYSKKKNTLKARLLVEWSKVNYSLLYLRMNYQFYQIPSPNSHEKVYDVTSYLQKLLYVIKNRILPELYSKTKTYSYKYSIRLFAAFADGDNCFPEDWQIQNWTTLESCPHSQRLGNIQKCNMGSFLFNNSFFLFLIPVFCPGRICVYDFTGQTGGLHIQRTKRTSQYFFSPDFVSRLSLTFWFYSNSIDHSVVHFCGATRAWNHIWSQLKYPHIFIKGLFSLIIQHQHLHTHTHLSSNTKMLFLIHK